MRSIAEVRRTLTELFKDNEYLLYSLEKKQFKAFANLLLNEGKEAM